MIRSHVVQLSPTSFLYSTFGHLFARVYPFHYSPTIRCLSTGTGTVVITTVAGPGGGTARPAPFMVYGPFHSVRSVLYRTVPCRTAVCNYGKWRPPSRRRTISRSSFVNRARTRGDYDGKGKKRLDATPRYRLNVDDDGNVESLLEDLYQANEAFSGQRRGQTDQCLDERWERKREEGGGRNGVLKQRKKEGKEREGETVRLKTLKNLISVHYLYIFTVTLC